jgi:hypothetical protein
MQLARRCVGIRSAVVALSALKQTSQLDLANNLTRVSFGGWARDQSDAALIAHYHVFDVQPIRSGVVRRSAIGI